MRMGGPGGGSADVRRIKIAIGAAGVSSFALLYAPQPVLAELAVEYDLDPGQASLAISVATGALALAVLPVATLSEFVSRRTVIITSVVASLVLGLLLPLAPSYPVLLVVRGLQGAVIAGVAAVAAAFLMEQVGRAGVAAAVGAMVAGNTLGGLLGRLTVGLSADQLGWRGGFAAVGALALACTMVVILVLPQSTSPNPGQPDAAIVIGTPGCRDVLRRVVAGVRAAVGRPILVTQYIVAALGMGAFVAMYNVAGFRLTGEPFDLSPGVASLVFLAYAIGSISSVSSGALVLRVGRRTAVIGALAVTACGPALTLPESLPLVVLGYAVLTGGFFASHAVANSWAVAEAPEHAHGEVSGIYALSYYVGSAIGGTAGSVVYGNMGWNWLVVVVVSWLILPVILLIFGSQRWRV